MGKLRKPEYYTVQRIEGVKSDEVTGETKFLIKWLGYSKAHNTWEPLSNLGNVQTMLEEYLLKNGYKPMPSALEEEKSHENGKKRSRKKQAVEEEKEETDFLTAKHCPSPSPSKNVSSSVLSSPLALTSPISDKVSFLSSSPKDQLSSFMTPIQDHPPQKSIPVSSNRFAFKPEPQNSSDSSSSKGLFSDLKVRRGNFDSDNAVKVIGCRGVAGGEVEYAVMFSPKKEPYYPLVAVVKHRELVEKAGWLFTRFFLANHRIP